MNCLRKNISLSVVFTLLQTACSTTPIVRLNPTNSSNAGASMTAAMHYLDTTRTAYRDSIGEQMEKESMLASALVGAGALVAILAAGTAHSDAILGVAAIGGTAYTLGNMNLRRQRVLTYQAGVEALNCAQRAVIPFDVPQNEAKELADLLNQLETSRRTLATIASRAQALRDALPERSLDRPPLDLTIALAGETRQAADNSLKSGRQYVASVTRASRELSTAVNRIDAAVVRSVIDSTPDLTNVPKLIAGLAGMMGSFAPGSGLETRITDGLGKLATAKSSNGQTDAQKMNQELAAAVLETATLSASVNDRLAGRVTAWSEDAFKDCGVAQVVADLAVSPPSLSFVAGVETRRVVEIGGGVKPYFIEVDGTVVDGFNLKPPIRFDNRAEVFVSSKVIASHNLNLRVSDSSPTAKVLNIPVAITAAVSAPAPAASAPKPATSAAKSAAPLPKPASSAHKNASPSAAAPSIDQALAILMPKGQFTHSGKAFLITAIPAKVGAASISIGVRCPAGDTTKYSQANLASSLMAQAGISEGPPKPAWGLKFAADGSCLAD